MATKTFKAGDEVKWKTPQGEIKGTVVKKETGASKAEGHKSRASESDPKYRVKSDKSGKEAVHKAEALKKA
nr:DUF2945 domain-containing protein [Methylobacterium sp. OTU13CASTA1]